MLAEYTLLIQANRLRAFQVCFTAIMIRPLDSSYLFEILKDELEIGNPKLLEFVNPIFDTR